MSLAQESPLQVFRPFFLVHRHYNYLLSIDNTQRSILCIQKTKKDPKYLWKFLPEDEAAYFRLQHIASECWLTSQNDKLAVQYSSFNNLQNRWRLHPREQATFFWLENLSSHKYLNCDEAGTLTLTAQPLYQHCQS